MPYQELEQFLDTKQARILEMFTVWNLLGFVAGLGIGEVLANLSGVGFLTPLCIIAGIAVTLRHRNMLVAFRAWLVLFFFVRRWVGRDVITASERPTIPTRQTRMVVLERVVNGQVIFGRRRAQ